jgi:hypothetical protein
MTCAKLSQLSANDRVATLTDTLLTVVMHPNTGSSKLEMQMNVLLLLKIDTKTAPSRLDSCPS